MDGTRRYGSTRLMEAQAAAAVMGAEFHPPICDDLAIFLRSTNVGQSLSRRTTGESNDSLDARSSRLHGRHENAARWL